VNENTIKEMLEKGEGERVEFKRTFQNDSIETIVAFANARGGSVLIGVDDAGVPIGTTFGKETSAQLLNRIASVTEPTVVPEVALTDVDGKTVCVVSVSEYPLKPVSIRGRCYRRVGNANSQMPPAEIAQMHMRATGTSWDALPATGKTVSDINLDAVANYVTTSTRTGRRHFPSNVDPVDVLHKLELITEDTATWAAILLFGKRPQSPLIQATVHCGRFRQRTHIMDDRLIEGSILYQIDETMAFLQKHINVRFEITGEKAQRDTIWDYPLRALREAVTNAICHRDYSSSSDIQIKVFDDSIRIWNPGVLAYDLSFEQLRKGDYSSRPRNKLIAQIFYDIEIIERYGSGIGRIDDACREAGLQIPQIEDQAGGFTVTFRRNQSAPVTEAHAEAHEAHVGAHDQLTNIEIQVLKECKDAAMGTAALLQALGYSSRTGNFKRSLTHLLKVGLLEMTIPDRPKSPLQKYRITLMGRRTLKG
jgi:ATP-dependent DNA helicase RecG